MDSFSKKWGVSEIKILPRSKYFDLDQDIKPLITLGRFVGIIPCGWSTWHSYKRPKIRFTTLKVLIGSFFVCWCLVETILIFYKVVQTGRSKKYGAMAYLVNSHTGFTSALNTFVYIYFLCNSDQLYVLLERWRSVSFKACLEGHKGLRYIGILSVVFMMPSICAVAAFVTEILRTYVQSKVLYFVMALSKQTIAMILSGNRYGSRLQAMYEMWFMVWNLFVPYNPCFTIGIIIGYFLTSLARTFGPALVIFFSHALSFQFKMLIENAANEKASAVYFVNLKTKDKQFWKNIVHKHESLCLLVKYTNEFVSPIIFATTALSIYNISMQLFRALTLDPSVALSPYLFTFSFTVEVIQYFLMLSSASNVNEYAIKILDILRKCPKELYNKPGASRQDHQVSEGEIIAFSGLGWYFLTKRFILTIISAIFTIEIILLESEYKGKSS